MTTPGTPDPRNPELVRWLAANRFAFTDDALHARMAAAGWSTDEINAAFEDADEARATAPPPDSLPSGFRSPSTPSGTQAPPGAWVRAPSPPASPHDDASPWPAYFLAIAAMIGVPLVLFLVAGPSFAPLALAAALVLAFAAWLASTGGRLRNRAKGLGYALLTVVLLPVVAVVGLFGYCLVAGAPRGG